MLKWAGAHPVLALHGECGDDGFNTLKMRRRMMKLVAMMMMMMMMRAGLNYSGVTPVVEGHTDKRGHWYQGHMMVRLFHLVTNATLAI